jgi:hypothetical protein
METEIKFYFLLHLLLLAALGSLPLTPRASHQRTIVAARLVILVDSAVSKSSGTAKNIEQSSAYKYNLQLLTVRINHV